MAYLTDASGRRLTGAAGLRLLPYLEIGILSRWSRYGPGTVVLDVGAPGSWDDYWVAPNSVVVDSGTLYLYYAGGGTPGGGPDSQGLATSTDGITWTKSPSNPILAPAGGAAWDSAIAGGMRVLKEGASWYGWYYGSDGGTGNVGYATSADGIAWTRYGSNPVMLPGAGGAWDSAFVTPHCVWKEGTTYYMTYGGGSSGDNTTYKFGLATSPDRVTWTKSPSNPIFAGVVGTWEDGVLDGNVVKVGSTYHLWYQGNSADQNYSTIGHATSPDLVTWTRDSENPMPRGASGDFDYAWTEGPVVFRLADGTWMMLYMGAATIGIDSNKRTGLRVFA